MLLRAVALGLAGEFEPSAPEAPDLRRAAAVAAPTLPVFCTVTGILEKARCPSDDAGYGVEMRRGMLDNGGGFCLQRPQFAFVRVLPSMVNFRLKYKMEFYDHYVLKNLWRHTRGLKAKVIGFLIL